jgi:histidine triad (HIT) family protein
VDCLFCKIIKGEIPSDKVYEDDFVYAFNDIHPEAPVHVLIVPKKHIDSLNAAQLSDQALLGHIQLVASELAKKNEIDDSGYRLLTNIGKDGGQSVFHVHYHLLGGRNLKWPPG